MVQLGKSVKYNDDCEVTRYREKFIGKATIVIKEFHPDDKSAALYAWGIAICGPRETFDENEGTRRANGRADWVINRYEKWGCDFSVYQKRYSYKHNRKLLKENQLSLSEKEQFDSLDEIVDVNLAAFFDADFSDQPEKPKDYKKTSDPQGIIAQGPSHIGDCAPFDIIKDW